jgi:hypothetical protein
MDFYAVLARVIEILQQEGVPPIAPSNASSPSMMRIWQTSSGVH